MERELSVLILSPHPQTWGGVSTYVETLKKYLRHCAVTSFWVGAPTKGNENPLRILHRLFVNPLKIAWWVYRRNFDMVHINPSLDKKALIRDGLMMLALVLTGYRRTMIFFHGWDEELRQNIARNFLLRRFFVYLLNQAGHIIVLAPEFKTALTQMGVNEDRISLSRTMVDSKNLAMPALGVATAGRPLILFMSRFDRRKGVYELLEAFAAVAADFPDWALVMAGDGAEAVALQNRTEALGLQSRVSFPGYVTENAQRDLLQHCSLFVLPTSYPEGMPIALLEAMVAGKPLLTTQAGGIRHVVSEPENGVVLNRVTVDTVAAGLRRLLSDAAFRAEVGQRNAAAARRFDAALVTAEIEAIYHAIARVK